MISVLAASQVAARTTPRAEPRPDAGWRVDVGAGVIAYPVFPGAKDETVLPIPQIEIHDANRFFASVREGVGYNLIRRGGLEAGPVSNFVFPRNESDKRDALRGLGNVDFALEAGGFARYNFGRIASVKTEVRHGLTGHDGLVIDNALDLNAPPLDHFKVFFSLGPHVTYYDQRYAQTYYGVTPRQSERSGYTVFRPADGYKAGVGFAMVYLASNRVTVTAFGAYDRLLGDVGNSPIVQSRYGSRDQYTIGTAVSYRFRPGG
jgi:outer membrane protein